MSSQIATTVHVESASPGRTVLHVEDDPASAELVTARLHDAAAGRYVVESVHRLADAITRLRSGANICCVLLDLGLPDVGPDDLATVATLTGISDATPPVVVLTGRVDGEQVGRALRVGAEDWLPKAAADGPTLVRTIDHAVERHAARRHLLEREMFIRSVLDAIDAQVAVLDRDGVIREVNSAWTRFAWANGARPGTWGPGVDYLEVCDAAALGSGETAAEAAVAAAGIRSVLDGRAASFDMDYPCATPSRTAWFTMRVTPLRGSVGGAVVSHVPITRLKERTAELEDLALHDDVTGLVNLKGLEHAASTAQGASSGVVVVELTGMRLVNAGLGRSMGDELLRATADLLRGVPTPDGVEPAVVARLEGDRFALLLPNADDHSVVQVGNSLLRLTEAPGRLAHGDAVDLRVRIGTATTAAGEPLSELLRRAEAALQEAHRRGVGSMVHYDRELQRRIDDELVLRRDLAVAIREGLLAVATEPIVDVSRGRLCAVEALVRWTGSSGQPVAARRLVDVAMRLGALGRLFDCVLSRSLELIGAVPRSACMVVNVDPRQLDDPDLADLVRRRLHDANVSPDRIWLELTGTTPVQPDHATLSKLADVGVGLILGEIGAGPADLAAITHGPWDGLRLAPVVVAGLGSDPIQRAVLDGVAGIARARGAKVGAVGVETQAQVEMLGAVGIDLLQGRAIQPPA